MPEIDLKAYTSRAKELEAAIYTQKRLMTSYETVIKEQHPEAPQKMEVQAPVKPELHKINRNTKGGFIFAIILMLFVGVCGLIGLFATGFNIPVVVCLVLGVLGGICTFSELDEKKSNDRWDKLAEETYKQDCDNYPILLENTEKRRLFLMKNTKTQ